MNARLPIFVLDTCSALNLSKIYIDDKPILLYLIEKGRVKIPQIVLDEYKKNVSITDEPSRQLYTSFRGCKDDSKNNYCIEIIKREAGKIHIETRKHKGEIVATALVLWLSRITSEQVILVTDEFRIYKQLDDVINIQHAGKVFTSFDLLLFLFSRLPQLSKFVLDDMLRDLRGLFPDSREGEASKAEIKLLDALKKLKEICRYEKCSHRICYSE